MEKSRQARDHPRWQRIGLRWTQAQLVLTEILARGNLLTEDEAGRILSNRKPAYWVRLSPCYRKYFVDRARHILEACSKTLLIYDTVVLLNGENVRVWVRLDTRADELIQELKSSASIITAEIFTRFKPDSYR